MTDRAVKRQRMSKQQILNYIGGEAVGETGASFMPITNPSTGETFAEVVVSSAASVDSAVAAASAAHVKWNSLTTKARALVMHKLYELIRDNREILADAICKEHGKTRAEALAEVAKGNETVEYACSYPIVGRGASLEVSRGVHCEDRRESLGVVAHIVPFNFPAMVPLWTIPIALAAGNTVVLKPSEKVPLTMSLMAGFFKQAGFPDGAFNIVNGTKAVVEAICAHPDIQAVSFVGSSPVAKIVADLCAKSNKRVLAMGGAKNHLVAIPDCEPDATATDIVGSFTGCCGQRCMAASVLVIVKEDETAEKDKFSQDLLSRVVAKASALTPGQGAGQMGPLIDQAAVDKVNRYIAGAVERGATLLLDGRKWDAPKEGFWAGPTVILHPATSTPANEPCLSDEIFGPVISVVEVGTRSAALTLENSCPYGNAACIYTSSGANAEWFSKRFTAAMIGVNIGVPVPREPFSFGGMGVSKFGNHGDITGDSAVEFFSRRRKITSRWPVAGSGENMPWFK